MPLAPLHQPFALEAMEILLRERPDIAQIACFDTGFHHSLPKVEQILPLPYEWWQRACAAMAFTGSRMPIWRPRWPSVMATGPGPNHRRPSGQRSQPLRHAAVAEHGDHHGLLGPGRIDDGHPYRCAGPGAVLYLMEIEKLTLQEVGHLLYHDSGLLGVSGISSEPRVILRHVRDSGEAGERARIALDLFVRRIVREIGSLVAALGGWTCWCSRRASASTARRFVPAFAPIWHGWAWSWMSRPMQPMHQLSHLQTAGYWWG